MSGTTHTKQNEPPARDYIAEAFSQKPVFILRYGSIIGLCCIVILFCSGFFISYDQGVNVSAVVTSGGVKEMALPFATTLVKKRVADGVAIHPGEPVFTIIGSDQKDSVITAATEGIVRLPAGLAEKMVIPANHPFIYLQPLVSVYDIEITVLQQDLSKFKKGQAVTVSLERFPKEKYGKLSGRIGDVPARQEFADRQKIKVLLDAESTDLLKKTYPFFISASGNAIVMTGAKSILTHVFQH